MNETSFNSSTSAQALDHAAGDFAAKAAVLAAIARSAAQAEETVLSLRSQLGRAKEIARAEGDQENELLRQRIVDLAAELAGTRDDQEAQMNALRDAAHQERERAAQLEAQMNALRDAAHQERERAAQLEAMVVAIQQSTSWRLMAPLRTFVTRLRVMLGIQSRHLVDRVEKETNHL